MSELQHAALQIRASLARLRTRIVQRATFEGLALAVLAGALLFALGVVALGPLKLGASVRLAALAGLGLALLVPVLWRWIAADRRWRDDVRVAAQLERAFPELRNDVRAAIEFSRASAPNNNNGAALRVHLASRVAKLLGAQPSIEAAVPRRDVRRLFAAGLFVWLGVIVSSLIAPDSMGSGLQRLVWGVPARVEAVAVAPTAPLVTTIDLEYRYPAYTGLPPKRVRGSTGDVTALAGTTVLLQTQALLGVRDARVVVGEGESQQVYPLTIGGGRVLQGSFPVLADANWTIELEPEAGGPRRVDPIVRRIRVEADEVPTIELLSPPPTLEIGVNDVIDIEYIANDDYGLGAVELVWYFTNDEQNQRTLPLLDATGRRSSQEHVPFELQPLALQPRDELVAYIQAYDNDAIAGAKRGRSRPITMRVAAPEDRHAEVLDRKKALFENLLARLGVVLPVRLADWTLAEDGSLSSTARPPGEAGFGAMLEAAAGARTGWAETITLFDELLDLAALDTLSVASDNEMLRVAYERLVDADANHARAVGDALEFSQAGSDVAPLMPATARTDAVLIERAEQAILLFEDLIAEHQADDAVRTLQELNEIRERLRDLLEEYRNTNDPALREQIERELRRLETRMRELLAQLASQVANLPLEHLNAEGLDPNEMAENIGEMTSSLDAIREALENDDIESALQALDNLGSELEAMTGELGGALEQAGSEGLSEFDQAMGELMDEINTLEQLEQEIESETARLEADMNRARQEEMREEIDRRLAEARARVAELQQTLRDEPNSALMETTRETLIELDRGLEQLESTLEQGDIATALEQVSSVISGLSDLEWSLEQDAVLSRRDPARQQQAQALRGETTSGRRSMMDVRNSLQELVEQSQPRPDASQQQRMGELSEQQGAARERLEQLGQRMGEMGEQFPMPGPSEETMQQVGEGMGQSQQNLQGGRPRPAQQGQMQALEGLRTMRQQLQQMMQQQRRQQQQQGRQNNERVEIPEESEANRARFRQQVLDGMREGGLESYDEQLRYYYESLVR